MIFPFASRAKKLTRKDSATLADRYENALKVDSFESICRWCLSRRVVDAKVGELSNMNAGYTTKPASFVAYIM